MTKKLGGATRDRTADLLHAMQALSQLSYSPVVLDGAHIRAPTNFCQQINSIKQRLKGKGPIFRGLRARAVPAAGVPAAGANGPIPARALDQPLPGLDRCLRGATEPPQGLTQPTAGQTPAGGCQGGQD